jgi:hypothetical protein
MHTKLISKIIKGASKNLTGRHSAAPMGFGYALKCAAVSFLQFQQQFIHL